MYIVQRDHVNLGLAEFLYCQPDMTTRSWYVHSRPCAAGGSPTSRLRVDCASIARGDAQCAFQQLRIIAGLIRVNVVLINVSELELHTARCSCYLHSRSVNPLVPRNVHIRRHGDRGFRLRQLQTCSTHCCCGRGRTESALPKPLC